ncbi:MULTISPECIES: H-NS family nucleoid-associated regulatory protein [unclassified Roseobacter]|uniref:H-NS family nucleoid-associated regulatory protein n=1 Tax=unclassified Roseobacter TaxID=196798 RepID=UPI001C0F1602|nr:MULTISPECIES: H-NS family nucleoid-associated regulatory protein [unclassified Roseobacter]
MRQKPGTRKSHGESVVKDIRRAPRKQYSAEEKPALTWSGHGRQPVWIKEGLEAGKTLDDYAIK